VSLGTAPAGDAKSGDNSEAQIAKQKACKLSGLRTISE
jgi:hypothetical protein